MADANTKPFRDAYALTGMVQWLWRTRSRQSEVVDFYMPSKKMRMIVERWLSAD